MDGLRHGLLSPAVLDRTEFRAKLERLDFR
jgi:hypothetical protein